MAEANSVVAVCLLENLATKKPMVLYEGVLYLFTCLIEPRQVNGDREDKTLNLFLTKLFQNPSLINRLCILVRVTTTNGGHRQ